jgi:flagellin FlaB
MARTNSFKNERGQTALETAIILIAFVVVASVFAFTILSAGASSTEKSEGAIAAGLEGVQSSMSTRGSIIAMGNSATPPTAVDNVTFNLALVSGGDPVDLTPDDPATATAFENVVVISYRDTAQVENQIPWDVAWVGQNDGDNMLEAGELAEITIDLSGLTPALGTNTAFTLEVKPPTGAVFQLNSTTPAAIEPVMELR